MNRRIRDKRRKRAERLSRARSDQFIKDNGPWEFETAEYFTTTYIGGGFCGPCMVIYKSEKTDIRLKIPIRLIGV